MSTDCDFSVYAGFETCRVAQTTFSMIWGFNEFTEDQKNFILCFSDTHLQPPA